MEVKGHLDIDFIRSPNRNADNLEKHTGDTFRECRPEIWNGARDPQGCQLSYSAALIPVPDRPLGCRQDIIAASAVYGAEADARADQYFR